MQQISHDPQLTAEHIRSTIERARQAWLNADATGFAELFTPSGQFIVPGQRWTGPEHIKAAVEEFSSTSSVVSIDIEQVLIDGHQAAVAWAWQERENETGTLSTTDDVILVTFHNTQIAQWREYIDDETP